MLHLLKNRSFGALTLSQFLGAFNDNAFKQLVLVLIATVEGGKSGALPWVDGSAFASYGQALPAALFALPFVVFGPVMGAFADRLSKSTIVKSANVLEIIVMVGGAIAFWLESYGALLATVFLMGTQSAIFGPAKYGIIKEIVGRRSISPANALIQSSTMIAVLLGTVIGSVFSKELAGMLWAAGLWYIGFATVGWIISLRIGTLEAADPERRVAWNPLVEFRRHWRATDGDRYLILSILASSLFYLIAATFLLMANAYAIRTLGLEGFMVGALNGFTVIGIALGALWAGRISQNRIEGGLVPMGLFGMTASSFLVLISPTSFWVAGLALFGLGVGAGLFTIPIRCLIQTLPREENRGGVQGLAETLDFVGILLAGALFYLYDQVLELTPPHMFAATGVLLVAFAITTLVVTAEFALRLMLLLLTHTIYRVRVRGMHHVPKEGGVLLVSNHVSFVDALLIGATFPRSVRFLMFRDYFEAPFIGWFARKMGAIPVSGGDTRERKAKSLKRASEAAAAGEVVCIFAEGAITRTGAMLPFARGLERIAREADVPIVPMALDRLWGSLFSYKGGASSSRNPTGFPIPSTCASGSRCRPTRALPKCATASPSSSPRTARSGRGDADRSPGVSSPPPSGFSKKPAIGDTTGSKVTFSRS